MTDMFAVLLEIRVMGYDMGLALYIYDKQCMLLIWIYFMYYVLIDSM